MFVYTRHWRRVCVFLYEGESHDFVLGKRFFFFCSHQEVMFAFVLATLVFSPFTYLT